MMEEQGRDRERVVLRVREKDYEVFLSREETYVSVECPVFDGCTIVGDSRAQALVNIRDAIELYLHGWRLPADNCERVSVSVDGRDFEVVISPPGELPWSILDLDAGFFVECPALVGCFSQGDSREEALVNIQEAISLCLKDEDPRLSA